MSTQNLAELSNTAVYGAMVVLALALVGFAADLALGTGRERARTHDREQVQQRARAAADVDRGSMVSVGAGATITAAQQATGEEAGGPGPGSLAGDGPADWARWGRIGVALTTLAWLLLGLALLTRGLAAGRPPWGNMYEFVLAGAWWVLTAFGFLLLRRRGVGYLGVLVVGASLVALGSAVVKFYVPAADLVPALKSTWLWIHVSAATLSAGVFTVGTAATLLYLVRDRFERRQRGAGSTGRLSRLADWLHLDGLARRLPDADSLDRVAYRAYAFAFPLWFFVLVSGAIWADGAWGRYWGWDPKETWSFVTLVVYAAYLHARSTAGWRGRSAAVIALVGYVTFVFNFVGVNIFFSGLHSYGGV